MPRLQRSGSDSETHTRFMICVMMSLPPAFSISAVMVQIPGALPYLSFVRTALTSAVESGVMETIRVSGGVSVQFLHIP